MGRFTLLLLGVFLFPSLAIGLSTESRIDELAKSVARMQQTADFNNQRLASALASFEQVTSEIAKLRGDIEAIQNQTAADTVTRQKELQEMDHRLLRMEERLGDMSMILADLASLKEESPGKGREGKLYDQAFSELVQKHFKSAITLFGNYIKKYPASKMADNAQYWIGECYFSMSDFEKAILEFQKVVKKYPTGDKVAAAILKQGLAFAELKSYADSEAFLKEVTSKYPTSAEAIKAQEKLVEIGKKITEQPKPATVTPPTLPAIEAPTTAPTNPAPETPPKTDTTTSPPALDSVF